MEQQTQQIVKKYITALKDPDYQEKMRTQVQSETPKDYQIAPAQMEEEPADMAPDSSIQQKCKKV